MARAGRSRRYRQTPPPPDVCFDRGSRRRRRWRFQPALHYAALDLGTNNCRLLVAHPTAEAFQVVDSFSRIVRLGEGLSGSGQLSDEAMFAPSAR
jgi:exopolyphosphatase / guanosine-5'-triphosphate,3'-diphosphate pyrophosphatase